MDVPDGALGWSGGSITALAWPAKPFVTDCELLRQVVWEVFQSPLQ